MDNRQRLAELIKEEQETQRQFEKIVDKLKNLAMEKIALQVQIAEEDTTIEAAQSAAEKLVASGMSIEQALTRIERAADISDRRGYDY